MRGYSVAVCAALLLACREKTSAEAIPAAAQVKPASALALRLRGQSHFPWV